MSILIKCERCSVEAPNPGRTSVPADWHVLAEYDVCPDCYEAFKDFIRGEAVPKVPRQEARSRKGKPTNERT